MRILLTATLLATAFGICVAQGGTPGPQIARVSEPERPQINPADFQADLSANRAKWAAEGIKSYVLKERLSCFCPRESTGPFDITVINGAISTVKFSADSGLTGEPRGTGGLLTINGAFERVQGFLNRDTPVARLSVSYDATQGYITSFSVDIDVRIADEEQGYSFELVRVITSQPNPPTLPKPSPIPLPSPLPIPSPITKPPTLPKPSPFPFALTPIFGGGKNTPAFVELKINRLKWRSARPNIYTYRLVRGCFCAASFRGPFIVTVTKGKVTNVVLEGTGAVAQSDIPTIDGLFDFIAKSLSRSNKAGTVEVDYDVTNGIPKKIVIDKAQIPVDGGATYTAQLLKGLPVYTKTG